jgi:hypothetical protein
MPSAGFVTEAASNLFITPGALRNVALSLFEFFGPQPKIRASDCLQHKPVPGIILKRAEDNALSKTGYDTAPAEDKYLQLLSFNRPFDHLLDPRIHQNDLTTNDVAYHRAGVVALIITGASMSVGICSKTMSRSELGIQASALVHAMQRIKQTAPACRALSAAPNVLLIVLILVATKTSLEETPIMFAVGHSLHGRPSSKSCNVRYAPVASKCCVAAKRRAKLQHRRSAQPESVSRRLT